MRTGAVGTAVVAACCAALVACATTHSRPIATAPARQAAAIPPPPPPTAPCHTQNFGTVSFQNRSKTATQDVVVNGETVCTLPPLHSKDVRLQAGVAHDVIFYVGDTPTIACGNAPLTIAPCGSRVFYCAYP